MKALPQALLVFSAVSIGLLANAEMPDSFSCAPIQANVHDKLRCREDDGKNYIFDSDCCGGTDYSNSPARCANGFTKTETKSCGHGHDWCDTNGCRSYTCEKSASCVKYLGCFKDQADDPALPFKASNFPPASATEPSDNHVYGIVSACSNYCRKANFSLAAVQGDNTCRCGDGNLYNKYGPADERFCGFSPEMGVAQRCGDGDYETCGKVNAVYRLTGTEFCCEYQTHEEEKVKRVLFWYFLIGPLVGGFCALFWTLVPCVVGGCIYCSIQRRKRAAASATYTTTHVADATPQPPVNAVMVTVMDPATQKSDVVVAQSADNPVQPTL